jgi:hypothetical protein
VVGLASHGCGGSGWLDLGRRRRTSFERLWRKAGAEDLIREVAAELVQKAAAVVLALEATAKVVLIQRGGGGSRPG